MRKRAVLRRLFLGGACLALASCSFGGGIALRGEEYAFVNIPRKQVAGEAGFRFRNRGREPHEMVVVGLNDGSGSIQEVLRLPEQEAMAKLKVMGRSFAEPGQEGPKVTAQLKAGRYALMCFLPTAGSGPPHFTRGMVREFTVA